MEKFRGLLKIKICRGINLPIRDLRSSDPYVIIQMGKQELMTGVVKKNVNPVWNEDLTLSVEDPDIPVKLKVFDKDTLTIDDKMGEAEFDIKALMEVVEMHLRDVPDGHIIKKVIPSKDNCLAEESFVTWSDGKVAQDMCLRLRNAECGEIELKLQWIDLPGSNSVYN